MLKDEAVQSSVEDVCTEEEMRLRAIFASPPDAIIVSDLNGNIIDCNQATLDMGGFSSKGEVIGKNALEFIAKKDRERAMENLKKTFEQGSVRNIEYTFLAKYGHEYPAELSASVIEDSSGNHIGFVAITKDITERKQMEEALKKSEERYRSLVELAPDPIITVDKRGIVTSVNNAVTRTTGYSRDELVCKHLTELRLFSTRDIPKYLELFSSMIRGKTPKPFEVTWHCRDGTVIHVEAHIRLLKDKGETIGIQAIARDFTERKKAEEAVRESEEKYKNLFENARDPVVAFDLKGNITSINKVAAEYGFKVDEMIGKNMLKFIPKKNWPRTLTGLAKLARGKLDVGETEIFTPKGKIIVEYRSNPIRQENKVIGYQTILRDITERKKMEEKLKEYAEHLEEKLKERTCALRQREQEFKALVENAPDVIARFDKEFRHVYINPAVERETGMPPEAFIGKTNRELGTPEALVARWHEAIKLVFETGQKRSIETKYPSPSGIRYYSNRLAPEFSEDGSVETVLNIGRDITERKRMEEALRGSEKKFKQFFENAPEYCYMISHEGKILDVNRSALKALSYNRKEVIGKPLLTTIYAPSSHEKAKRLLMKWKETGKLRNKELNIITKRGEERIILLSVNSVKDDEGKLLYSISVQRDITERKQMQKKLKEAQEQLLKSEKLAAIGEVATMVGHDLRNPLQSIENAAYVLNKELQHLPSSILNHKKSIETLQVIDNSVDYADKIIRDLQDFSATKKPISRKTDVNALVEKTLSRVKVQKNVELVTELGNLPEIKADKDMIKRVFLNLTVNAIQAMKNGGTLKVSTKKTGRFVEVSFKDTGRGISKKDMKKLFTPFFTTKAKGMGMGLAICKRFMESHDGSIQVETQGGKGSTFTVKLPVQPRQMEVKTIVEG